MNERSDQPGKLSLREILRGKTILLVSDDEEMIRACRPRLERVGARVPVLSINEGVVEQVRTESPDLITVDMKDTRWTRAAWREILRVAEPLAREFARAPVFVTAPPMSGQEWPEAHAQQYLAGVDLCWYKPFDLVEFLIVLLRTFESMEGAHPSHPQRGGEL